MTTTVTVPIIANSAYSQHVTTSSGMDWEQKNVNRKLNPLLNPALISVLVAVSAHMPLKNEKEPDLCRLRSAENNADLWMPLCTCRKHTTESFKTLNVKWELNNGRIAVS